MQIALQAYSFPQLIGHRLHHGLVAPSVPCDRANLVIFEPEGSTSDEPWIRLNFSVFPGALELHGFCISIARKFPHMNQETAASTSHHP